MEIIEKAGCGLFCLALIPVIIIDLRSRIIPDWLTLPSLALGLGIAFLPEGMKPLSAFIGALLGGGLLFLVGRTGKTVLGKEGMGGGDIKLMTAAGAFLGPLAVLYALFLGSLFAILFVFVRLPFTRRFFGLEIPFGPFLAAGIYAMVIIQYAFKGILLF